MTCTATRHWRENELHMETLSLTPTSTVEGQMLAYGTVPPAVLTETSIIDYFSVRGGS